MIPTTSMTSLQTDRTYKLPPLILHPFADANGPGKLVESSRASLMLQGLLPSGDRDRLAIERALLDGRPLVVDDQDFLRHIMSIS